MPDNGSVGSFLTYALFKISSKFIGKFQKNLKKVLNNKKLKITNDSKLT